jgi:hypothetical protein
METAVTGVLLFQIRFFESDADPPGKSATDPRVRVLMLIVLTATLFGSLEAIREGGGLEVAVLVTVGLAVSILPILLRVLPTLRGDAQTRQRDPHFWITVLGLILHAKRIDRLDRLTGRAGGAGRRLTGRGQRRIEPAR